MYIYMYIYIYTAIYIQLYIYSYIYIYNVFVNVCREPRLKYGRRQRNLSRRKSRSRSLSGSSRYVTV